MADLDQNISHDAYCIAEEIINAIPLAESSRKAELVRSLQQRLQSFAQAILQQASDQPARDEKPT